MKPIAIALLLVALGQESAPTLQARVAEVLARTGNGHSPTPEETAAVAALDPVPDVAAIQSALPVLNKALADPDSAVRTFALTMLAGLESTSDTTPKPAGDPSAAATPLAAAFKPEVAAALAPSIPAIAAHLTEESSQNRLLTAQVLGGFTPNPPAAVYPPLLAYLRRDNAIGATGIAVVTDLVQLGPISAETAAALTRYLRRSDQTDESRANLVDAIAGSANQSPEVDKALLGYLLGDDPAVKSRLILSLPQLDLPPDVFADTRARIQAIAEGGQDSLQVVNAAKAIATCWTATRMQSGCPVY